MHVPHTYLNAITLITISCKRDLKEKYTQLHPTLKMNMDGQKQISKVLYTREIARLKSGILLLLGLVRSLNSSNKGALRKPLLFEDYSDFTSPTSNHMPDIHLSISVVCGTFEKNSF